MTLTTPDDTAMPKAEEKSSTPEDAALPEAELKSNMPKDAAIPKLANKLCSTGPLSQITFPNRNTARLLSVPADTAPFILLEDLNLSSPRALIIIAGGTKGFDEHLKSRLYQFCRGIDRAASGIDAIIIDPGTASDGMSIMEDTVAYRRYNAPLIGFSSVEKVTWPGVPEADLDPDKVSLDPDHSHFVLVDTSDRDEEIGLMYRFAEFLKLADNIPIITVLMNGGKLARAQVLRGVRMRSPVIVFKGSGGLADEIAQLIENQQDFIEDPELAEIIQEGEIRLFSMESPINGLERLISRQVRMDSVLKQAWHQFAIYDLNALRHQRIFQDIQNAIVWLGVLATTLALIHTVTDILSLKAFLHHAIILIPILIAIFLAAANEFKSGNKWILLRGSAELLKSHIFRYRAQAETSAGQKIPHGMREMELSGNLERISTHLMQTEVNLSALRPYDGQLPPTYGTKPGDDGFSLLSPENYLETRLEDQLKFYIGKTANVEKRLHHLQWLVYIVGGLGTMLAAFGLELWVALTGSLAAAFGTHIKYEMLQESLTKYNQAAMALTNVRNWWISLPAAEQAKKSNINLLVENTEGILRSEFSSWVQEMQDTIAALQKKDAEKENEDLEEENKPLVENMPQDGDLTQPGGSPEMDIEDKS